MRSWSCATTMTCGCGSQRAANWTGLTEPLTLVRRHSMHGGNDIIAWRDRRRVVEKALRVGYRSPALRPCCVRSAPPCPQASRAARLSAESGWPRCVRSPRVHLIRGATGRGGAGRSRLRRAPVRRGCCATWSARCAHEARARARLACGSLRRAPPPPVQRARATARADASCSRPTARRALQIVRSAYRSLPAHRFAARPPRFRVRLIVTDRMARRAPRLRRCSRWPGRGSCAERRWAPRSPRSRPRRARR